MWWFRVKLAAGFLLGLALVVLALSGGPGWRRTVSPSPGVTPALAPRSGIEAGQPPNVLLITVDTARADHFSSYGYHRPTTPNVDRLAHEGVLFEAAYTPTPTTAPAHASLFTSSYPSQHGLLKNGYVLEPGRLTLAEALKRGGYNTAAFVSSYVLARPFGLGRGFAHYDDDFGGAGSSLASAGAFDRRADHTTDRVIDWLQSNARGRPLFVWVHYFDPHHPYAPPARYRRLIRDAGNTDASAKFHSRDQQDEQDRQNRMVAPGAAKRIRRRTMAYDAEIRFVDDQIGRLVGHFDRSFGPGGTLVIIATDHGEGLMQRGWMAHGVHLHEELVRVALVMRWPAHLAPGLRLAAPVGLIDIAPTVLSILKLPGMPAQGEDLSSALLRYTDIPEDRALYFQRRLYDASHHRGWNVSRPMFGIRRGQWKYIQTGDVGELFDLRMDPRETDDRHDTNAVTADALAADLRAWREKNSRRARQPQQIAPIHSAPLRALGYVE